MESIQEIMASKDDPTLLEINQAYQSIKEAAENTLIHLNHHIENFAPFFGVSMINSYHNF
jgi:hypothetical protein